MATFADALAASSTGAPLPVAPTFQKPSIGARFGDVLGGVLGIAPPDRVGAFNDQLRQFTAGVDAGGQYRLRSAQTDSAMAEAEKRRADALRQSLTNDLITKAQADPNYAPSVSDLLTIATGAGDFGQGQLRQQEAGFRSTLADPNAAPQAAFAAGQGVQGRVLPQIEKLDTGREINLLTQQPNTNPVGQSAILENEAQAGAADALAALRGRTDPNIRATSGGAGAGVPAKLPVGALKIVDEATQAVGAADRTATDTAKALQLLESGGVNLGVARNLASRARNYLGESTPESRAYTTVQSTLEQMRNAYLLLAKGVQTEGDALRAWNSEVGEAAQYDNQLAKQQLERAQTLLDMGKQLQNRRIEGVYQNYGGTPPPAYGGATAAPPAAEPLRGTSRSGKPIISRDGGQTWEYE